MVSLSELLSFELWMLLIIGYHVSLKNTQYAVDFS
jgi:hypothetical protein